MNTHIRTDSRRSPPAPWRQSKRFGSNWWASDRKGPRRNNKAWGAKPNSHRGPKRPALLTSDPVTPHTWVSCASQNFDFCDVTPEEVEKASKRARAEIVKDTPPVKTGLPHLIITIGAPGSGKSTVAGKVAATREKGKQYIVIDYDLAVKYHPRFNDIWDMADVDSKPSGVGWSLGYITCNQVLEEILANLFQDLIEAPLKYNIILQSHSQVDLVHAKINGYRTTLLFVGTPLPVALQRSRTRAVTTGKFLAPTLRAQDHIVTDMWKYYAMSVPWYGLWADEFIVADNRKDDSGASAVSNIVSVQMHACDTPGKNIQTWYELLQNAQKIVDASIE